MGNESHDFFPEDPQPGPSWQRAGWPLVGGAAEDDLTQALDPMALKAAIKASAQKAGAPVSEAAIEVAVSASPDTRFCRFASVRPMTWSSSPGKPWTAAAIKSIRCCPCA